MQAFFDSCHSAGPEACAFYASSPAEIEANLETVYDAVRAQPVPVFSGDTFGVITYDALRMVVVGALQQPANTFPQLAAGLAELSTGNGTIIYQLFAQAFSENLDITESMIAIECSDADPLNVNASQLENYMSGINSTFAGTVALPVMTQCSGWMVHPESRFKGPVGANTSFPLLVIGNTADPITPLSAAKKTSSSFPGSVVLQQDSVGHTSLSSQSSCTFQHLAAYFNNGTLPAEGTICSVDISLFPGGNGTDSSQSKRSLFRRRY